VNEPITPPPAPLPKIIEPLPSRPDFPVAAAPAPLDLDALKKQLKDTKAIGIFTKLSLKNKVDDLMEDFRDYYAGKGTLTLGDLRQSYNLLIMKVLSLVQDDDPELADSIVSSRDAIWDLLADPKKFATLET
jgi:hypothetical protein